MTEPTVRRQRRRTLTDRMVAALPRKRRRYVVTDPEQRGMYVRVPSQGPCVFAAVARSPYGGKQRWATLGTADVLKIEQARDKARAAIRRIKEGLPAFEPPPVKPDSLRAVAENWLKRHVAAKKLRSRPSIERLLRKLVYPHWAGRDFDSLRRSDIAALLDHVQDHHGARQADLVLAIVRGISNWFAARSDAYLSPFVRGMRRVDPKASRRSRVLDDEELRAVWRAAEEAGTFGAFVRLALLTAQRRDVLVHMRWDDLDGDVWQIPQTPRAKGNGGDLELPPLAMEIIRRQPKLAGNPHVLAGRNGNPFRGFANGKPALDKASGVRGWIVHDCRRTARSLMARAGVISEHAERVLGHARGAIEEIYDRHAYFDEKGVALAKLAALIERIVNPPAGDVVVPIRAPAAQP
jgi:integrase